MKCCEFAETQCGNVTFYRNNPSVKIGSLEPILTAPFTQGSLWVQCKLTDKSEFDCRKVDTGQVRAVTIRCALGTR